VNALRLGHDKPSVNLTYPVIEALRGAGAGAGLDDRDHLVGTVPRTERFWQGLPAGVGAKVAQRQRPEVQCTAAVIVRQAVLSLAHTVGLERRVATAGSLTVSAVAVKQRRTDSRKR
jgi:hypothetical protein